MARCGQEWSNGDYMKSYCGLLTKEMAEQLVEFDNGEQCQQVTPAMLMGNFFVSERRSLGRDNKIRVIEVRVGNAIFCTFCSLFDPVRIKFMIYYSKRGSASYCASVTFVRGRERETPVTSLISR